MEQYIPKSALVAEIKKRKKEAESNCGGYKSYDEHHCNACTVGFYEEFLEILNTIKVKEVDLEDSIKESLAQKYIDYTFKRHNIDPESREGQLIYYAYMHGMNQCLNQLKAQKGE